MLDLVRRVEIAQAAFDLFDGRTLEWGVTDCWRMAAFAVREAGGPDLLDGIVYGDETSAARAMVTEGYRSLPEAIDGMTGMSRRAVAFLLPGDLVSFPSDYPMGALGIAIGQDRALGFVEHEGALVCMAGAVDVALTGWNIATCLKLP